MPKSLDALLSRAVNPLRPLLVGDLTVGWVGPHLEWVGWDEDVWFAVVGETVYPLSFDVFAERCHTLGVATPRGLNAAKMYAADFFFKVPVGAVDISGGTVDYTELTVENLGAAISNFVPALKSSTQSRLNNAEIHQAAKIYGELLVGDYPYIASLRWRGTPISEMRTQFFEALRVKAND